METLKQVQELICSMQHFTVSKHPAKPTIPQLEWLKDFKRDYYDKYDKIYNLPYAQWKYYESIGVDDMPEQVLLYTAKKEMVTAWNLRPKFMKGFKHGIRKQKTTEDTDSKSGDHSTDK